MEGNIMRVLITGGTGSFGGALVERLLQATDYEIVVFSRDEYKQYLMKEKFKTDRIKYVIGNIRDINALDVVCQQNIDYIFHAAAMKHVSICEENPLEAVLTNVIGTKNVLEAAIRNKVKKVVVLSTDKAVCPQSTMGQTKALAEKIALSYAKQSPTKIVITRFGNLITSRGSVLGKFINLAKEKKSLPITSYEMNRFMMGIDEAIDLVLFAFNSEKSNRIFVKKAKVFNILDLAKCVNELYENNASIKYISKVKGERENEWLFFNESVIDHGDFYEIDPDGKEGIVASVSSGEQQRETIENIKSILLSYIENH